MRGGCVRVLICVWMVLAISQWGASRAEAVVFVHEVLADPASGLDGDANADGVRSSTADEFIELFNLSTQDVDISSWSIADASATRHVFDAGSVIAANSPFVVFGGGDQDLMPAHWTTASAGSLYLNNGGDSISLFDAQGQIVDAIIYGAEAGYNQSITRSPEGEKSAWIKHSTLANAQGALFSPGVLINPIDSFEDDDIVLPPQSVVPEPATIAYLAFGLTSMLFVKKR